MLLQEMHLLKDKVSVTWIGCDLAGLNLTISADIDRSLNSENKFPVVIYLHRAHTNGKAQTLQHVTEEKCIHDWNY